MILTAQRPRRPRVLLLTKTTEIGGAERLLASALSHLDRDRFDYRLTAAEPGGPLEGEARRAGIPWHPLAERRPLHPRNVAHLRERLVRERIDLVHAHLPLAGVLARVAARGLPTRVVYTEHNVQGAYHPLTRRLNLATYGWQQGVVAVAQRVRESALEALPARRLRPPIEVVENGLDLERLQREASRPPARPLPERPRGAWVVLVPASLEPRKGQDRILEAAAWLAKRGGPRVELWLAGRGPWRRSLERLAHRLGIRPSVHFLGFREDLPAVMMRADAVALPSRFEGHPLALLEALALGRPTLATAVGGIPEIVRGGHTGLLVESGAPEALARTLARLLASPALRAELGEAAARDAVARFEVRRSVRATEALYERWLAAAEAAVRAGAEPGAASSASTKAAIARRAGAGVTWKTIPKSPTSR